MVTSDLHCLWNSLLAQGTPVGLELLLETKELYDQRMLTLRNRKMVPDLVTTADKKNINGLVCDR